jgi:hypothetical protein
MDVVNKIDRNFLFICPPRETLLVVEVVNQSRLVFQITFDLLLQAREWKHV